MLYNHVVYAWVFQGHPSSLSAQSKALTWPAGSAPGPASLSGLAVASLLTLLAHLPPGLGSD